MVDGRKGSGSYNDGIWQAVQGSDMTAVVDLGEVQAIKSVSVGFFQSNPSWIFVPRQVEFLASTDGNSYNLIATIDSHVKPENEGMFRHDFKANVNGVTCRYIKIVAYSIGNCPDWHPAAGSASWLFADEIVVE